MAVPHYYFPVNPANRRPKRGVLSAGNISYDVFYGTFEKLRDKLGQDYIFETAKDDQEVMRHFQRFEHPYIKVNFYNSIFGNIYTLQDHDDGFKIITERSLYALANENAINKDETGQDTTAGEVGSGEIDLRGFPQVIESTRLIPEYQGVGELLNLHGIFATKSLHNNKFAGEAASAGNDTAAASRRSHWGRRS